MMFMHHFSISKKTRGQFQLLAIEARPKAKHKAKRNAHALPQAFPLSLPVLFEKLVVFRLREIFKAKR
ncbi:hypothetical protein EGH73_03325 [Epilithonimonas hominis]|nr:hypothetical protein EGH73_03325 [Epilithonimonas hominis]